MNYEPRRNAFFIAIDSRPHGLDHVGFCLTNDEGKSIAYATFQNGKLTREAFCDDVDKVEFLKKCEAELNKELTCAN